MATPTADMDRGSGPCEANEAGPVGAHDEHLAMLSQDPWQSEAFTGQPGVNSKISIAF